MSFMQLELTRKGSLYTCECSRCGATLYTHEWATWDHNERRDAMEAGTLRCDECSTGHANPDTNRRAVVREVRSMYGEA